MRSETGPTAENRRIMAGSTGGEQLAADCLLCDQYKQIFSLRNTSPQTDAVNSLIKLFNSTSSVLLRHEVAYVLGQMRNEGAVPFLTGVLIDSSEDPITRHEAAEALGAIGKDESRALLEQYSTHEQPEVAETCGSVFQTPPRTHQHTPSSCYLMKFVPLKQ